jgi:hypothetical protein
LDKDTARVEALTQEVALLRGTVSALRATRRAAPKPARWRAKLIWLLVVLLTLAAAATAALAITRWVAVHCT